MSHELRSPLNAILGFAQLMESATPPPTPAQRESVDQILQAGWYLLVLINEILDLALIESGKISLSPEPIVARRRAEQTARGMIRPLAMKKRHRIDLSALQTTRPFVKADQNPSQTGSHQFAFQCDQI